MIKTTFFTVLFFLLSTAIHAQTELKYWVGFSDKANSPYSVHLPHDFLSQRSLERRQKNMVETDLRDLPPTPAYLDSLKNYGLEIHFTSRWFNGAVVSASDTGVFRNLDHKAFIREVLDLNLPSSKSKGRNSGSQQYCDDIVGEDFIRFRRRSSNSIYGRADAQTKQLGLDKLHSRGFLGQGMLIAVFDAGFRSVDKMEAFRLMWEEERVLLARDFVGDNLYGSSSHGTGVLSTMAASLPGDYLGTAPAATYILCRTEDAATEYPIELYNWLAAAELADSAGADIINSSLGYHHFDNSKYDYSYTDMDGKTILISRAAAIAASKGILVVTSVGNLGQSTWQKISAPADADSILAVGAVNENGIYAPFSSQGPSADGRIKPEVVAVGWKTYSVASNGSIIQGNGTSYSSPIIAGAVACLMQSVSNATAQKTREAIIKSSSQYFKPDSLKGYGIPNFSFAQLLLSESLIIEVNRNNELFAVPNPFDDYLEFAFHSESTGRYNIKLINSNGKEVIKIENQERVKGLNYNRLDSLKNLRKGVYVVVVESEEKILTQKMVKI